MSFNTPQYNIQSSSDVYNQEEFTSLVIDSVDLILKYDDFSIPWESKILSRFPTGCPSFNNLNFARAYQRKELYRKAIIDLLLSIGLLDGTRDHPKVLEILREVLLERIENYNMEILITDSVLLKKINVFGYFKENLRHKFFIHINNLPDLSYQTLQLQINQAYELNAYPVVEILIRKMIENLIIDIFRKMNDNFEDSIGLFFNLKEGKYHDIDTLLRNLESKIMEIKPISGPFYQQFIEKTAQLRKNWIENIYKSTLDEDKIRERVLNSKFDIESIIRVLIRLLMQFD